MKNIDWLYGFGITLLLLGLLIWIIPPIALFMIVLGTILILVSKKKWAVKLLSVLLPIILWYILLTSYY
ncbi:MAG: hypothetical protein HC811_11865 [Flammeovirgaceae bacterium]|nr:hypothetical protein [Flammeovirgaceae bacterium]